MNKFLPAGKLPPELMGSLFSGYEVNDPSVLIGPKVGEDAAVIDVGDSYLVAKTDPITFATDEIGWYLVCINSNDIACMGANPRWLLVTALLPENKTSQHDVENIFLQITRACDQFGITLCGGHTEVTYGLDRPIIVGQMLGQVDKDKLITSSGAQVDDDILLTKGIAIEAVSIIAREKEDYLLERNYSPQYIDRAKQYLKNPGISVLKDALVAAKTGGVNAMHDPTEGGLATGLHEIARCSDVGMIIWQSEIEVFPECQILCHDFDLDILGVIASGALLIVSKPECSNAIIKELSREGIKCLKIGKVLKPEAGVKMEKESEIIPLPVFGIDEITKVFA
ncbi:hydrogenase expression/formation protein [Candidatus Poribacteria bacterium]|nr:hydrogenase expression/formation protein [Candidatus Poribacteria bacterium]